MADLQFDAIRMHQKRRFTLPHRTAVSHKKHTKLNPNFVPCSTNNKIVYYG